jgi:LysR family glycine cleavage system transcriptional activator
LNAIRAFEAAARHESFTRAAVELSVTQAAVSHQVKLLEGNLGIKLFKRALGGLKLTGRGMQYFISINNAMQILVQATEEVCGAADQQTLGICAQPNFASRWLIPRLSRFIAKHPVIVPSVRFGGSKFDFSDRTVDVAIRYGCEWPELRSDLLFHPQLTPACTPSLGLSLGQLNDLRRQVLLRTRYAPDEWRLWLDHAGLTDVDHTRGPIFDSTLLALEGARSGLGVALGRLPLLAEDLRDGLLMAPFDVRVQPPEAWHLVYPDSARTMPKVIAFRSWILGEAERTCAISARFCVKNASVV